MKLLETEYVAAIVSVTAIAGAIAISYINPSGTQNQGRLKQTPAIAERSEGYCDVYYLQESRPETRDVEAITRLGDGRTLWTARLRGEDACAKAPAMGKFIGSTAEELRANPDLSEKFQERPVEIESGKHISISEWPREDVVHKWCCE